MTLFVLGLEAVVSRRNLVGLESLCAIEGERVALIHDLIDTHHKTKA